MALFVPDMSVPISLVASTSIFKCLCLGINISLIGVLRFMSYLQFVIHYYVLDVNFLMDCLH